MSHIKNTKLQVQFQNTQLKIVEEEEKSVKKTIDIINVDDDDSMCTDSDMSKTFREPRDTMSSKQKQFYSQNLLASS